MRASLPRLIVVSSALLACSSTSAVNDTASTGGSTGGSMPTPYVKTKIASASAGEVLEITADIDALTYAWTTLKSAYVDLATASAAEYSGTGTLAKESATSSRYLMTDDATKKVVGILAPADNGTLLARLAIPALNGQNRAFADNMGLMFGSGALKNLVSVPVLGVTNATSQASSLAATYNLIALRCTGKSKGFLNQTKAFQLWNDAINTEADALCTTTYGTILVSPGANETSANLSYCLRDDLGTKKNATKCTGDHGSGKATFDAGNGVWLVTLDGETATHALVAFTSAQNGQRVGWLDSDGGVLGYGQVVLAEQQKTIPSTVDGTYVAESSGFNSATRTLCGDDAAGVIQVGSWGKVTVNKPWTGLGTFSTDGSGESLGMMSGAGVFIYRSPTDDPWALELGTRVSTDGCSK